MLPVEVLLAVDVRLLVVVAVSVALPVEVRLPVVLSLLQPDSEGVLLPVVLPEGDLVDVSLREAELLVEAEVVALLDAQPLPELLEFAVPLTDELGVAEGEPEDVSEALLDLLAEEVDAPEEEPLSLGQALSEGVRELRPDML